MARFTAMINQFNGGYMTQRMNARTNLENWPNCVKDSCNFIPTVWGGNKFRSGTKFVSTTEKSHFIPFIFNNSIAYVVEFCDGFCRFYRDGVPVLTDEGEPLVIDSPYSYDSITGANGECLIKKQQSADVMYIATGKHPLYKLLRTAENNFSFLYAELKNGPFGEKKYLGKEEWAIGVAENNNIVLSYEGASVTTDFLVKTHDNHHSYNNGTTMLFDLMIDGEYVIESWSRGYEINHASGYIPAIYSFFNTYDFGFTMVYDGTGTKIRAKSRKGKESELAGKKILIRAYARYDYKEGHTYEGIFSDLDNSEQFLFNEEDIGKNIRLSYDKTNVLIWAASKSYGDGAIVESDGKYYIKVSGISSDTSGNKKPIHNFGTESDGAIVWEFLDFGYLDGKIVNILSNNKAEISISTREINKSIYIDWIQFSILGGKTETFASSIFFYKERLGLTLQGGKAPQIAFSQTGDYENFDPLVEGEVVDESAILSDLVVGEVDVVNWGVGLDDVLLATESNFLLVSPATTAENFSPTNIKIDYISSNGAGKIAPVVYGDAVVYLDEKNTSLFTNGYYWESDGYRTAKISWPAEDLFEGGIKGIAYQKDPDSCFWILTKSGDLISFVYEQAQNVSAFGYHATDGEVQTLCCIPSSDGKKEELWLNVKRVLPDGTIKYCVEVMKDNSYDNALWSANRKSVSPEAYELAKESVKRTFWYVDSGVSKIENEEFTEVEGLSHLEGKTLVGLADGKYVEDLVVEDGKVNLGVPCNYAIVGLPYEGYFVPNNINAGSQNGASQGKTQRIHAATIRVFRSRDFKCGDGIRMKDVIVDKRGVAGEGLLTGDIRIAFPGTYSNRYSEDTSAEIVIKQDKPYPLCVNGLILEMETYDA